MIYHNSIDVTNRLNPRLVAYATSHQSITAEQQQAVNNIQLLAIISLLEQQKTAKEA